MSGESLTTKMTKTRNPDSFNNISPLPICPAGGPPPRRHPSPTHAPSRPTASTTNSFQNNPNSDQMVHQVKLESSPLAHPHPSNPHFHNLELLAPVRSIHPRSGTSRTQVIPRPSYHKSSPTCLSLHQVVFLLGPSISTLAGLPNQTRLAAPAQPGSPAPGQSSGPVRCAPPISHHRLSLKHPYCQGGMPCQNLDFPFRLPKPRRPLLPYKLLPRHLPAMASFSFRSRISWIPPSNSGARQMPRGLP